jgi:transporter family-2 protein
MGQIYIVVALAIGLLLPLQVGINAELAQRVSSPITAAFISFAIGTIGLMFLLSVSRVSWPNWNSVVSFPAWLWLGGLIGAFAVFGGIISGPKIGLLSLVALVLTGQLVASLIMDHNGWLGLPIRELSLGRISGSILLLIAVVLIHKY